MGRTGRCLCGKVSYEIEGDALATVVCHCRHCQRSGGSAFSVNVVVRAAQLTISGSLGAYEWRGTEGDAVYVRRKFCDGCGSPIVSELLGTGELVAVKAGTLDDTSDIQPMAEVWCVERQPWMTLPIEVSLDRES